MTTARDLSTQVIPLPFDRVPLSVNQVRRMHHYAEAKVRAVIIAETVAAIRRAKTRPMWSAEVILHYRPGTRRRMDTDGLDATKKSVTDALVRAEILTDDSFMQVPFSGVRVHPPAPGVPAAMWVELTDPDGGTDE